MTNRSASVTLSASAARARRVPILALARSALARVLAALAERRRVARELEALRAYSDLELRDLCLSRVDVRAIEKGTFRRE